MSEVALVTGTAILLGKDTVTNLISVAIYLSTLVLMRFTRLHPVLIILDFGLLGLILF